VLIFVVMTMAKEMMEARKQEFMHESAQMFHVRKTAEQLKEVGQSASGGQPEGSMAAWCRSGICSIWSLARSTWRMHGP